MSGAGKDAQLERLRGTARIQAELKRLRKDIDAGRLLGVTGLDLVGDRLDLWRIKVSAFDADTPTGRQLNRDLAALEAAHGEDAAHVVLEASFPADYPSQPFFLRVVRPRMAPYSGHVTAGGSICIQALTQGREEGCWRPHLSVQSILALVLFNFLNAESVVVRTAMGGGQAGPLRIAMERGREVLQEYSRHEADSAFQRTQAHHARNGWGGTAPAAAAAAAPPPAAAGAAAAGAARAGAGAAAAVGAGAAWRWPAAPPAALPAPQANPAGPSAATGGHPASRSGSAAAATTSAAAAAAQRAAAQRTKRAAPDVIDLLSDSSSQDEDATSPPSKRQALKRPQPAGGGSRGGGGGARLAAATAAAGRRSGKAAGSDTAAAAAAAADDDDLIVDMDLTGDGEEEGSRPARLCQRQQQQQQQRQQPRPPMRGWGAPAAAAALPAEPAEPAELSPAARLAAANAKHGLDWKLPPPHWLLEDQRLWEGRLVLVELPLPGRAPPKEQHDEEAIAELRLNGVSRQDAIQALKACGGSVDESLAWLIQQHSGSDAQAAGGPAGDGDWHPAAMAEMRANGLSREDAEAALRACGGRVQEALEYAVETMQSGGPSAVERRSGGAGSSGRAVPALAGLAGPCAAELAAARRKQQQEAAAEQLRRAELEEAEEVLAAFQKGGVDRNRVARIERVQHLELHSLYLQRRARVALEAGAGDLNERRLFHGADKETLHIICAEGFDHRVSNMGGAMGAGVYFAKQSSYSETYSLSAKRSATLAAPAPAYAPRAASSAAARQLRSGIVGGIYSAAGLLAPTPPAWGAAPGAAAGWPGGGAAGAGAGWPGAPAPAAGWPGMVPAWPAAGATPAAAASHIGQPGDAAPRFLPDGFAMLLCSVALGKQCAGRSGLRRPDPGTQSAGLGNIFAVFDNHQAYPSHIIHFK